MQLAELVDLDRYPLEDPGSPAWNQVVAAAREGLGRGGCVVLPDVVREDARAALRAECAALEPLAWTGRETVNVYNTAPDPSLPPEHPARWTTERGNSFVARDHVPADAGIHRLYGHEGFRRLLADCFGLAELHELADPFAGLCLNVVAPGAEHPWHFDTNEFSVSMLTQAAEAGGTFEYCPDIRSAHDENFAAVGAVLAGRGAERVRRLDLRPGDVQLFRGRYALHRVSPVGGGTARHTAIFSYSERAGVVGSAERTRQLFGRVLDVHRAQEQVRVDALLD